MEFHISTNLVKVTHTSLYTCSPKYFFNRHSFRRVKFRRRLNSTNSKPLQVALCSEKVSLLHENPIPGNRKETGKLGEDSEFVEVFGIGSRKEAILDFCLDSRFLSSSLRFWNILVEDSVNVQLQQRFTGKDVTPRVVEASSALQSCSKAVILVATAAYGSDHTRVVDILKGIKSANGLVVGIILKPFSFEGRRRQDEIKDLEDKLKEVTNFCIVVDTDLLLEKDLVTLDEALKTANTAVLMAVNAISILISKNHKKLLDSPQNNMKELKVLEVMKILESYKEAKIGFGAGFNTQTSFMRAIYDCPFLSVGLKDLDGIVFCILASSAVINSSNVNAVLLSFRQTTEYKGEIIISIVLESNLEPNLIMATVIAVSHTRHQASQESSIFSRLAQHFPFLFNLLRRNHAQSQDRHESSLPESPYLSEVMNSPESVQMPDIIPADETTEGFGIYSAELQTLLGNNDDKIYYLRGYDSSSEKKEVEFSEAIGDSSNFYDANTKGIPSFQREPLIRRNLGPGYQSSEEWASQGVNGCGGAAAIPMLDNLSIYKLPVGVKPSEELKNSLNISNTIHDQEKVAEDGVKQGVLSVRAASMLEAERDSQKKWNPIVEMKYRGGVYKGRCQGGLPEGKGRLSLTDGSSYDGMWRYGKRSGLGTFYFSNGDVFQGSWRDDVMHGKGWFYFHTGDRWFANFWKGKANGEGRFYSKLGEIFFGHFKDGWRHGHFLCINVDGARCLEIWDEGVLVSRKQLDADAGAVAG